MSKQKISHGLRREELRSKFSILFQRTGEEWWFIYSRVLFYILFLKTPMHGEEEQKKVSNGYFSILFAHLYTT
jgi:hypothetical protein